MNEYFVGLLVLCTVYALIAGGAPERIGAVLYALSCAATRLAFSGNSGPWKNVEVGILVVDTGTFALFCWLALRADRFWPIWVSALLGLGVLGHLARVVEPGLFWWAYAVALTIWSYPILALIALGTWAHGRRRARSGAHPNPPSSHWYTKYRTLPQSPNRPQLRLD